ncbi:MAG: hypothetical protein JRC68_08895 [Deltaproteobacteria bacterium]|nr:hypothetical protein [Deltaproteobacteria bacterium]
MDWFSRLKKLFGAPGKHTDPSPSTETPSDRGNKKIIVTLKRIKSTDQGTIGLLSAGDFCCYTMEPPWRDNRANRSCIPPEEEYHCVWHRSPRYGWVYLVGDVESRSNILIHPGNVGGDREKGLHTHTSGCILLGEKRGQLIIKGKRQEAVFVSRSTCRRFHEHMEQKPFKLEVRS